MQSDYKWDIDEINQCLRRLKAEYEILKENRDFMASLKEEVEEQWQSMTGTIYERNLKVDMIKYDQILRYLMENINTLDAIANKFYSNCETEVRQELYKIQGCITRV